MMTNRQYAVIVVAKPGLVSEIIDRILLLVKKVKTFSKTPIIVVIKLFFFYRFKQNYESNSYN